MCACACLGLDSRSTLQLSGSGSFHGITTRFRHLQRVSGSMSLLRFTLAGGVSAVLAQRAKARHWFRFVPCAEADS